MSADKTMSFWNGKSVLVTGATGLVGSWLVNSLLERGALVTALVLDNDPTTELFKSGKIQQVSVVTGNLENYSDVKRSVLANECSTVFHLGAQTIVSTAILDPVSTFKANIEGTWNILEAVRQSRGLVRSVVVASSDKAYGTSNNLPYTEVHPLHGDAPYDVSKTCTDLLAQSYGKSFSQPVGIARCGNIYGGGDLNWNRIVPGTIRSLLEERQPILRSDGSFIRDYVYVDDVVSAYLRLAEAVEEEGIQGEAFNFSRDQPVSVLEIYSKICSEVLGSYVQPKILGKTSSEIQSQYLNSQKAQRELGWEAQISLEEGLGKTVTWYKNYLGLN
jgi:CDP-glucose 4,6-dehydratase